MALSKSSLVLLLIAVLNSVDAFAPSCPALVSRKGIEEDVTEKLVPETTEQKRLAQLHTAGAVHSTCGQYRSGYGVSVEDADGG
jgi:hypothetical protein